MRHATRFPYWHISGMWPEKDPRSRARSCGWRNTDLSPPIIGGAARIPVLRDCFADSIRVFEGCLEVSRHTHPKFVSWTEQRNSMYTRLYWTYLEVLLRLPAWYCGLYCSTATSLCCCIYQISCSSPRETVQTFEWAASQPILHRFEIRSMRRQAREELVLFVTSERSVKAHSA